MTDAEPWIVVPMATPPEVTRTEVSPPIPLRVICVLLRTASSATTRPPEETTVPMATAPGSNVRVPVMETPVSMTVPPDWTSMLSK